MRGATASLPDADTQVEHSPRQLFSPLQAAIEVADVMHRTVTTARPEMPIAEAATLMVDQRIGGLPVVDDEERVVGVITETDIFRAFVERERQASGGPTGA